VLFANCIVTVVPTVNELNIPVCETAGDDDVLLIVICVELANVLLFVLKSPAPGSTFVAVLLSYNQTI
jgi:hypothetical protein